MSRIKKRLPTPGKQFTMSLSKGGQSKQTIFKGRPKHTYSLRPHDYLKRKSPATPPVNGPPPKPLQSADKEGTSYAALSALLFTTPRRYHHSCAVTPELTHTPKTGHPSFGDFDSYPLRYLAEKAISESKKVAEKRNSEQDRGRCRQHNCIAPPPLATRHKHYCGQKHYKHNGTMLQMMSTALGRGFGAFKSMVEDGPIGDSARNCRRRIKRLLRPIWCNCLRRTCLGPPADPIQRHVYSIGLKIRGSPHARELRAKLSQLPTSTPSSPHQSNLSMDGSGPADLGEGTTPPTSSEQQSVATQTPGCIAGCRLLKSNESTPLQNEDLHPKQQQQQKPPGEKSFSLKQVKILGKTESSPSTHPTHVHRQHVKGLGRQVHAGHSHARI